jgi:hypothetical protein
MHSTSHSRKKPTISEVDIDPDAVGFGHGRLLSGADLRDQLAQALGHFDEFGAVDHADVARLRQVTGSSEMTRPGRALITQMRLAR